MSQEKVKGMRRNEKNPLLQNTLQSNESSLLNTSKTATTSSNPTSSSPPTISFLTSCTSPKIDSLPSLTAVPVPLAILDACLLLPAGVTPDNELAEAADPNGQTTNSPKTSSHLPNTASLSSYLSLPNGRLPCTRHTPNTPPHHPALRALLIQRPLRHRRGGGGEQGDARDEDSLVRMSERGWVAMSKRRKLRFSVQSLCPCFSWKPILRTFYVSPGKKGGGSASVKMGDGKRRTESARVETELTAHQINPGIDTHSTSS